MTVVHQDLQVEADPPCGPRLLLAEHHDALEGACQILLCDTHGGDPRKLTLQYRAFEYSTLEHMVAEEELILPGYADHDPVDAEVIRREHAAIRQLLLQVGVEVELHVVRLDTVKRLIETLQIHAARENAAMYRWAQDHLPLVTRRRLFVRIGRALRALAQRP